MAESITDKVVVNNVNNVNTFDSLNEDLLLISKISLYQTISVSTKEIVDHKSWRTAYRRYRSGDSRKKTVEWIDEVTGRAMLVDHPIIVENLILSIRGIKNLINTTYSTDNYIVKKLNNTLKLIENTITSKNDASITQNKEEDLLVSLINAPSDSVCFANNTCPVKEDYAAKTESIQERIDK